MLLLTYGYTIFTLMHLTHMILVTWLLSHDQCIIFDTAITWNRYSYYTIQSLLQYILIITLPPHDYDTYAHDYCKLCIWFTDLVRNNPGCLHSVHSLQSKKPWLKSQTDPPNKSKLHKYKLNTFGSRLKTATSHYTRR